MSTPNTLLVWPQMSTQKDSTLGGAHVGPLAPNEQPPKMGVTLVFVTFVRRVAADEVNGLISIPQKQHEFA